MNTIWSWMSPREFGTWPISSLRLAVVQWVRQWSHVDTDLDNLTPQEHAVWERQRDAVLWIEQLTGRARQKAEALVLHQPGDIYYGFGVDYPPSYALRVGLAYDRIDRLTWLKREHAEKYLSEGRGPEIALRFTEEEEEEGLNAHE